MKHTRLAMSWVLLFIIKMLRKNGATVEEGASQPLINKEHKLMCP